MQLHATMKKSSVARLLAAALASALLLAGCGGSGGDGAPATPPSARFGASSMFAGVCTLDGQKQFTRAYLDEVYLWYNEIPEVDASRYDNIPDYFNALLVKTPDVNGLPKDRFSTVLPLATAQNLMGQTSAPPAGAAADSLLASHTDAVPVARVQSSAAGRKVGYIQLNDFDAGAQDDLITAFRQVRDGGAQDLVLDLRFNSGGFLYIAQAAASMVVGPSAVGQVFEQLRYNDKRPAETAAGTLRFESTVTTSEGQYPRGTALPQLGLPRLYVLTTGQTCSSSESVINSLRGIDVQVILVGTTTCGKPYGFRRKDNCGWAYFPIEFQGFNAKGFGNYTTGFTPTCTVQDNTSVAAGSEQDPLLNAALHHVDSGTCPVGTANVQQSTAPSLAAEQPRRPAWAGRLLLP